MNTILAAAALTVLCAPAFAVDETTRGDTARNATDTHYGLGATIAENQRANAASRGNVALTRGPDDPRYEGSPATPPSWKDSRGD